MAIRLVLVDDQELVRTGFRMVLDAQPDLEVVGEAGDGEAALDVVAGTGPDVVLMDVRMPRMDGVESTRRICARDDPPRVLILTTFDLDEYAFAALRAGASGFLLKDAPPAELLSAIRAVYSGDAVVAPSTTRRLIDRFVALRRARMAGAAVTWTASPRGNARYFCSLPEGFRTAKSPGSWWSRRQP